MMREDQAPILKEIVIEKAEERYKALVFEQFLSCAEEVNKTWTSIPVSPPFGSRLTDIPIPLVYEDGELEETCAPCGHLHYIKKKKADFGSQYPEEEQPEEQTGRRTSAEDVTAKQAEETDRAARTPRQTFSNEPNDPSSKRKPTDMALTREDGLQAEQRRSSLGEEKGKPSLQERPSETGSMMSANISTPSQESSDENTEGSNLSPTAHVKSEDKKVNTPNRQMALGNASENVTGTADVFDFSRLRKAISECLLVPAAERKVADGQSPLTSHSASPQDTPIGSPRLLTPDHIDYRTFGIPVPQRNVAVDNSILPPRTTTTSNSSRKAKFPMTTSWLDNMDIFSEGITTTTGRALPKETLGDIPDLLTPLSLMSDHSEEDNPALSTAHLELWEEANGIFLRDASDEVTDPDEITQPKREPISLNLPTFPSLCDVSTRMDEIMVPEEAKVAIWSHGMNVQSNQTIRLLHSTLGQQLSKAIMNCQRAGSLAYLYIPLAELSVTVARIIVDHFDEWLEVLLSRQSSIADYYLNRAELLKEIIAMPHLEDRRVALYWMDVQEYESCRESLQQIQEFYLTMHEEVRQNWSFLYEGRKVKDLCDY